LHILSISLVAQRPCIAHDVILATVRVTVQSTSESSCSWGWCFKSTAKQLWR